MTWLAHPAARSLIASLRGDLPRQYERKSIGLVHVESEMRFSRRDKRVAQLDVIRKRWIEDTAGFDWSYSGTPDQCRRWFELDETEPSVDAALIDDERVWDGEWLEAAE